MIQKLIRSLGVLTLAVLLSPIASAAGFHSLPAGKRMEAESWEKLPQGSPVADSFASGDKAVLLKRDSEGMSSAFPLERSYYALSVWVRASQDNTYLPPAYLELSVGDKTYRIRVRYNQDRSVYLPGYLTSFIIDKSAGYEESAGFGRAKKLIPNPHAKEDWRAENTCFYFPVDAPGKYTLTLKMGARSNVDFLVDRVELRDVLAHLPKGPTKKQRVLFSSEEQKAWELAREHDPRAKVLFEKTKSGSFDLARMKDEEIWKSVPDPYMPRDQKAGPCPLHGNEVYRKGGQANSWAPGPKPFHVRCLVGNEIYPSNDFESGDLTSGEYPDDGWGFFFKKSPSSSPEEHEMWFVGRRVYNRWQALPTEVLGMARSYVVTGDKSLAHKAGVALAAVAYHYPGYDYRFQSRINLVGLGRGGNTGIAQEQMEPYTPGIAIYNDWGCGKIFYSGWTGSNDHEFMFMQAYDLLFPALMKDQELLAFVGARMPWVKTFDDLQELFDRYLLAVHSDALIRRQAKSANSGWEGSAAFMGAIQDGPAAERILRELFTHANLDGTDSGGFADAIVNMLSRDGVGLIYSPMYLFGWTQGLNAAGEILPRIPDPNLRKRYGMAGGIVSSRIGAMAEFAKNIRVAGEFLPNVGDTTRANAHTDDAFLTDVWPMWIASWRKHHDPALAALALRFAPAEELLINYSGDLDRLQLDAKKINGDLQQPSRVMGGYGAVVLEAGLGQSDRVKKGAVFLPFGPGWGHCHPDSLNVELFAKGYRVLPDKGRDLNATLYHNVVLVDGQNQSSFKDGNRFGWLNHFAVAPGIRFVDLGARPHRYEKLDRYRRAVAFVDAPGGNQYLFDVFQVDGGDSHALGLHGPPSNEFTSSLKLGEPKPATKAFYEKLKNPQEGISPITGPVTVDWKFLLGQPPEKPVETDVHMHATVWGAEDGVLMAADVTGDIPFDIKGLHFKREGKGLFSNFVTLMDPYQKSPFVKSTRRLPVTGKDAARAAALEITMESGQRDIIAYNGAPAGRDTQLAALPTAEIQVDDELTLNGVLGYVASDAGGKVLNAYLVGGTFLKSKDFNLKAESPEYRRQIAKVDYATGEITLSAPLPVNMGLVGSTVVIGSPQRSRAYQIESLSKDGRTLRLQGSILLFQSQVKSVDEATRQIRVEFPFYMCKCDPAYYNGCVAMNESRSAFWRLKEVRRENPEQAWHDAPLAQLEEMTEADAKTSTAPFQLKRDRFDDADGDGRQLVYVYEIAAGDTLRITTSVHVSRGEDGKLSVSANVPCTLK